MAQRTRRTVSGTQRKRIGTDLARFCSYGHDQCKIIPSGFPASLFDVVVDDVDQGRTELVTAATWGYYSVRS